MSVSIDEDPAGGESGQEDARAVLTSWLDDYVAGRCERADMEASFLSLCRQNPEAPWDALALVDQYKRLGRIDTEVARDLKIPIEQLVFGVAARSGKSRGEAVTQLSSEPPPSEQRDDRYASDGGRTDDIEAESTHRPPSRTPPLSQAPVGVGRQAGFGGETDDEGQDEADDAAGDVDEELPEPSARVPGRNLDHRRTDSSRFADSTVFRMRARREPEETAIRAHEPRWRGVPSRKAPDIPVRARQFGRPGQPGASAAQNKVLRDRYELLSVLGSGGSSTVYRALDRHRANLSESARYVAVKVLSADFQSNPAALAELEREFHQAQSLSHPNIASVFDLDRDGGTYFIVMELLEGESLAHVLRRLENRPMARKHTMALIGSIGAALAHAHRRDIVHGDLKPRNIMITPLGEVRVLNFGLARSGAPQSGELDAGRDAVSIGTPAYASAERVHGADADPSDDVYSLACIAYELLSGRHPYGGRSAFLAGAHGRRAQRVSGLTHRQWHALQRALAWDRAERKIDVVDLLAALGAADVPQELAPPELLVLPDDTRARRLRALGWAAAVIAAIVFGLYLITRIPAPLQRVDSATAVPQAPPIDGELMADSQTEDAGTKAQQATTGEEETVAPAAPAASPASAPSSSSASVQSQEDATTQRTEASSTAPAPAARGSTIQFDKDTYVVTESEGSVRLDVVRTGSTRNALAFRWTLRANSAGAGTDFADIGPAVEQFPAGSRTASITIPLVQDAVAENTELFLVELEPMTEGVSLGELAHAAVIIVDDD